MDTNGLVAKLLAGKSRTPFIMIVRKDLGVKVMKFKRKKRWYLDTDLYSHSKFDYSEEGQRQLKRLAKDSSLSDGVQMESLTKRVFCVSFANDSKESVKYTYGVWLEAMRQILMDENCVCDATKAITSEEVK